MAKMTGEIVGAFDEGSCICCGRRTMPMMLWNGVASPTGIADFCDIGKFAVPECDYEVECTGYAGRCSYAGIWSNVFPETADFGLMATPRGYIHLCMECRNKARGLRRCVCCDSHLENAMTMIAVVTISRLATIDAATADWIASVLDRITFRPCIGEISPSLTYLPRDINWFNVHNTYGHLMYLPQNRSHEKIGSDSAESLSVDDDSESCSDSAGSDSADSDLAESLSSDSDIGSFAVGIRNVDHILLEFAKSWLQTLGDIADRSGALEMYKKSNQDYVAFLEKGDAYGVVGRLIGAFVGESIFEGEGIGCDFAHNVDVLDHYINKALDLCDMLSSMLYSAAAGSPTVSDVQKFLREANCWVSNSVFDCLSPKTVVAVLLSTAASFASTVGGEEFDVYELGNKCCGLNEYLFRGFRVVMPFEVDDCDRINALVADSEKVRISGMQLLMPPVFQRVARAHGARWWIDYECSAAGVMSQVLHRRYDNCESLYCSLANYCWSTMLAVDGNEAALKHRIDGLVVNVVADWPHLTLVAKPLIVSHLVAWAYLAKTNQCALRNFESDGDQERYLRDPKYSRPLPAMLRLADLPDRVRDRIRQLLN